MVTFEPALTEVVYFDTELYIPAAARAADRETRRGSLVANPYDPTQFLLGGHFTREFPLAGKPPTHHAFWIWDEPGPVADHEAEREAATLRAIFEFFEECHAFLRAKSPGHADLILVGFGIARFDLPTLLARCQARAVASPRALFSAFYKTKPVDLGQVGIPLLRAGDSRARPRVLYPASTRQLLRRFGLEEDRSHGRSTWTKYERGDYAEIAAATRAEVAWARAVSSRLLAALDGGPGDAGGHET